MALTYNIDDAGHLAVTLAYQRGNDEDTGSFANIYRIGRGKNLEALYGEATGAPPALASRIARLPT